MLTMQTKVAERSKNIVPEIINRLENGEVIILPTATTYALVAHGNNPEALTKIPTLKYWDAPQPLSFFTRLEKASEIIEVNHFSRQMMAHFPYPVTMIVPAKKGLLPEITNGFKNIFVVCPDQFIYDLVDLVPFPMACAPANVYADLLITKAQSALEFYEGKVSLIVDGGVSQYSRSGTLIDFTLETPTIMRFGPVSFDDLRPIIPEIILSSHLMK